ncbi:MAG: hypothetical protein AB7K52_02425 [Phycisphaerales bacterium]
MKLRRASVAAGLGAFALPAAAFGVINPFTETFDSAMANWSAAASPFTPLSYPMSGGPDGSAYGSRMFSFAASNPGDQPLMFRGQGNFGSSGNAFVGNWFTSGVTSLTFSVRHDGSGPIDFFARMSPEFGPGIVALLEAPVQPNTWTTFTVPILETTPFIYETFPAPAFATAFGNISRVQIGVLVGAGLAGQATPVTFDLDNVGIAPAPGAAALAGFGILAALRRRR